MSDRQTPIDTPTRSEPTQAKYQVRFDFGRAGLDSIGATDLLIWVDALGGADSRAAVESPVQAVVAANLTNRSAVAAWALEYQVSLGRRASIAVIAAGRDGDFSSADLLAAGAVIDALAEVGIDYSSPEAAVACAAFDGLKGAVGHLLTASVDGQALVAAGRREHVVAAGRVDSSDDVTVLRA